MPNPVRIRKLAPCSAAGLTVVELTAVLIIIAAAGVAAVVPGPFVPILLAAIAAGVLWIVEAVLTEL